MESIPLYVVNKPQLADWLLEQLDRTSFCIVEQKVACFLKAHATLEKTNPKTFN